MFGFIGGGWMWPVFSLEDQEVNSTITTFVGWRQENVPCIVIWQVSDKILAIFWRLRIWRYSERDRNLPFY